MARPTHPNKEIESAVQYAEAHGWRYRKPGKVSYCWGRLLCPEESTDGCQMSIWSTPAVPENHARQVCRRVDRCTHC